ncbi:MAG TPA: hypothetical protein V6D19_11420 [Stenomitos sp.]
MVAVNVEVTGLREALIKLKGLGDRASNVGPIARDILLAAQADVDERFNSAPDTQTGGQVYGGVDWPHLSEEYLNRNPRRIGGQLLRDTGELQQSYGIGGTGNIATVRPDQIVFGSALPKARGLANKRPQVFVHPALIETVSSIVELYVTGGGI